MDTQSSVSTLEKPPALPDGEPDAAPNSPLATRHSPLLHRYTLLAGLLIAFVGLVTFVAPTDPDVWWHLRNGQLIIDSGVPTHDVYSFTAQGRPWLVQEWLTELVMYGLKSVFGYGALSLLFGVLQALGAFIVYRLLRDRGAGRIVSLLLLMLYLVFAAPSWGVRPQVLTAVFLGSFYLVLTAYKRDPTRVRLLWLLPLAMVLWTNLHASYFMGIALVGAFIVGEFANNIFYRPDEARATETNPKSIRPLLLTLAACLAATLLNPYFVELWTYPLTYALAGTSNPLLRYTQEWQSPNFHEPANLLFGLSLVLLGIVGIKSQVLSPKPALEPELAKPRTEGSKVIDVTDAIVLAAFMLLALQAVRLLPTYGVMVLPLLGGSLARTWPALSREREASPPAAEGKVNWVVGAVGVVVLAFFVLSTPQAQTGAEPRADTTFVYPVKATDYLAGVSEPVRLYNNFAWGGYLIYRLFPQRQVFIDGRADMYREGIFDDFMTVQNVAPPWREVLTRYNVNFVMIVPGSSLDYALAHEPEWKVAYRDDVAVVYRR